jgi:hypothetical protein
VALGIDGIREWEQVTLVGAASVMEDQQPARRRHGALLEHE